MNQNINLLFIVFFYLLIMRESHIQPFSEWTFMSISLIVLAPLALLIIMDLILKYLNKNEEE